MTRLVIGIQLVKVGYQLPKTYLKKRFLEMIICLVPLMAIGWLATSACIMMVIPRISLVRLLLKSLYTRIKDKD